MRWTWLAPLMRVLYYCYLASGLYYFLQRVQQAILGWPARGVSMRKVRNEVELQRLLKLLVWKSDPFKGAVDLVPTPQQAQARVDLIYGTLATHAGLRTFGEVHERVVAGDLQWFNVPANERFFGDCDDFAVFAAWHIADLERRDAGLWWSPELLTVAWYDSGGRWRAHVVCMFCHKDHIDPRKKLYGHIGNWNAGQADLGYDSVDALVRRMIGAGATLVGYSYGDPSLRGRPEYTTTKFAEKRREIA